ncbi:MAG: hypothetical protein M1281_02835 [Chloroflexi bacterium]|nr:hypothetical protein [Chloroflexota bacterium]
MPKVIIVYHAGAIMDVLSDDTVQVIVADRTGIRNGEPPEEYELSPLSEMDEEIRDSLMKNGLLPISERRELCQR